MAGLLTVLVSFLDVRNSECCWLRPASSLCPAAWALLSPFTSVFPSVILGKSHYILYGLVAAMQPRMLVTFDEELRPLPVSVRVGQVRDSQGWGTAVLMSLCVPGIDLTLSLRLWMWWARQASPKPSLASRLTQHQCCWHTESGQSWPQRSTCL